MLPAHVVLGVFEISDEFPALQVVTPDASVILPAFEIADEFPGLTFAVGQTAALDVFEIADEFPDLVAQVPIRPGDAITGNYQIEYNGTLFGGHNNRYQIIAGSVEGWDDLPGLDSGNVSRPSWHGSWPSRYLSQDRQITATVAADIGADDDFAGTIAELRSLLAPPEDETGLPLVISARDEVLLIPEAVVDSRAMPTEGYPAGWVPVAVRWVAADPRRYNPDRSGVTLTPGQTAALGNAGNVATHPTIRIDGPAVDPVLANTSNGRTLDFAITLAGGERLTIDTLNGTATVDGDSVMSTLSGSSSPVSDWVLGRGSNTITFTTDSGGSAGAVFLWRDAWL